MATKQLDLTDLYQRFKLVVNTWIETIPFQTLNYKVETSNYSCEIDSNMFKLTTYRDGGFPSSTLNLTKIRKEINGTYSDLVFFFGIISFLSSR